MIHLLSDLRVMACVFFPPKFVIVTIIIVSLWILVFRPTLRSFIVTENISWSCVVFPAFLSFLTHVIIMAASPCVVLVENAVSLCRNRRPALTHAFPAQDVSAGCVYG